MSYKYDYSFILYRGKLVNLALLAIITHSASLKYTHRSSQAINMTKYLFG